MSSGLNVSASAAATRSPEAISACGDAIHAVSQPRGRRSVTPARSGPTRRPPPTVWQALHLRANVVAGSAFAARGSVSNARRAKMITNFMAAEYRLTARAIEIRRSIQRRSRERFSRGVNLFMGRSSPRSTSRAALKRDQTLQ